jgi:hypothetical protein
VNKDTLWKTLTEKNPKLLGEITLTAKGVYQFYERIWDFGFQEGLKNGKVLGREESEKKNQSTSGAFDAFKNMWSK